MKTRIPRMPVANERAREGRPRERLRDENGIVREHGVDLSEFEGRVVSEPLPGFLHRRVAATFGSPLYAHVERHSLGVALIRAGFVLARPTDSDVEIRGKVAEYLRAGTRLVWVVDPEAETVTVDGPRSGPLTLAGEDVLDARDVIPGLRIPVEEIFEK